MLRELELPRHYERLFNKKLGWVTEFDQLESLPRSLVAAEDHRNSQAEEGAIIRHPGSVNLLMMDGSVRGIKSSISPTTWWALSTMAGGEVLDASSY